MNQYIINHIANIKLGIYHAAGFLIGCYLGLLVIRDNPYFLLIAFSIPLALMLFINSRISVYIIMFSIFFADWLKQLSLIPDQMTWLPDIVLIFLTIKVAISKWMNREFIRTPVDIPLLLFIIVGLISMLINSGHIINTLTAFRFDLKFVLMFFLLVNLNLDEKFFKRVLFIFMFLLLIQIPVALVKLTIYGQGESAIGTYGAHGGTYSTILPMVVISIASGLFLFEKPRVRYIFFILLFMVFSIVGGKRAFVFLGFLLFLFLFWQAGRKNLGKFSLAAPFFIMGFLACVYFVPSLNPAFKNPRHLIDFTVSYTTRETSSGEATGRTSAIKAAYRTLSQNPTNLLLGFGPGSLSKSYFIEQEFMDRVRNLVPIIYGLSQWVTMSVEYGIVGTLLFLWVFVPLFKLNQKFFKATTDKYWKAISFGYKGILFTYLLGFFYSTIFRGDVSAFIFWFFSAAIYGSGKQINI